MNIPLKISGFSDYSEKENRLFSYWKKTLEDTYRLFGFMGFNPRPVESIAALQLKGGVSHQIYTLGRLHDGTMTDLALPFDRTIPLAVYVASKRHELVYPFKRFDISHSFRGERPQAGRARGFIQADIDIIDENLTLLSEVECLTVLVSALQKLRIPPFVIYLNHLSIPKALMLDMGFTEENLPDALRIVDKMDKIGIEKVKEELENLCPTATLSHLPLLQFKGSFSKFLELCPKNIPGLSSMEELLAFLEKSKINLDLFGFCPGMVRGLDYYTGVVFETYLQQYPGFGSVASGGRYNKLIDSIINQETKLEGFGISIGLTRLFDVLKKEGLLPETLTPPAQILVAYREPTLQTQAILASHLLREAGVSTDLYCGKSSIGKQIAYADKKEISYVFMVMGESFVIKNLKTGEQTPDIPSLEIAVQTALDNFNLNI
ncbi:MAG: ATP phosphoribosyltransferase regulatory subunit [Verrucomicrobia bacterium]|nr:ATP phosphoribosyltransferase regulatory subunit [Verrucomicrobiota bacterium]